MNAILKPVLLGLAAYLATAVGLWFVVSFLLMPFGPRFVWLLPASMTVFPLFISGFVTARATRSQFRSRRIALGVLAGIAGFAVAESLLTTFAVWWFTLLLYLGATVISAAGAGVGSRRLAGS